MALNKTLSSLAGLPKPPDKTGWLWAEEDIHEPELFHKDYSWPRISIVTPSYNQARFIEETIRSVLLQGYPNLEYIIMDGGSTDGSVEIIKKYEPWLTYWFSETDRGQSHAINKGWAKSTGELLAWINSDDRYTKGALKRAAQAWEDAGRPGLIHGICKFIDDGGNPVGYEFGSNFNLHDSLLSSVNSIAQPSTFVSHEAIREIGQMSENLHMSMDWDLWLRIAARYQVVYKPQIWSEFRIWNGSKSGRNHYEKESDHVRITKKLVWTRQGNGIGLPIKIKALARAYRRLAIAHYRNSNFDEFRKYFLLSLLCNPILENRNARSLIPLFFFGVKTTQKLVTFKNILFKQHRQF